MTRGEGERLHAQRRKRFWLLILALMAVGFIAGLLSGFITSLTEDGPSGMDPSLATLAAIGVVLSGVLAAYASYRFFVSVDELELADNLWGSLFGFYAYAFLLPAWWALSKLNRAPEPDHWVIYGASLLIAALAYLVRKWRAR